MQHIPLLFVLVMIGGSTVGCASTSLEELTAEAKVCVKQSTNLAGVVGASDEQRTSCWADANKKLEMMAKREKELEAEAAGRCPRGTVQWGDDWHGYKCISNYDSREKLRRMGY